jgi:hypothetical protein
MITQQIHIDLHLPQSWNHCTTDELESIAAAIINEQQRVDKYHPFDWGRVKLIVALSINGITVLRDNEITKGDESEWLVKRPQDSEPWPISTGQLLALTEMLNWVDDEKANKIIFLFPYPTLDVRCKKEDGRAISHQTSAIIHLQGPPPLLDGYTWQEYRWMTDWMQAYMRHSNAILLMNNEELIMKNREAAENARNEFLAILFKPCEKSQGTGAADHTSAINHLTSDIFTDFSPVKWQVILFWWSSLMAMLAKKFPKVFKQQPVGKGKRRPKQQDTPWDFYNRVTATIQKYIGGLSEQDVNNATYGTILQQLEMMADEAAEMEKLKHKK